MAGALAHALGWFGLAQQERLDGGAVDAALRSVERALGVPVPASLRLLVEVPGLMTAVAGVFDAQPVFPARPRLLTADALPGVDGRLLWLMTENQGGCAWGVPVDAGDDPPVLVAGDLPGGPGTVEYTAGVEAFVIAFAWDHRCLGRAPLLQAQAAELDATTLGFLRRGYRSRITTYGWPVRRTLRFQRTGVQILLWPDDGRCDWWISADHPAALAAAVRELLDVSDLRTSLWSNDSDGAALLDRLRTA
jgi:hypothetical protein